ncbi:hypothetical protein GJ744_003671 [Endocarpon pusillum]|uniref:Uncharacterized protein n=1 Tax=Endocarpon pusillum TaxID=364733 RepID=A0A8H7A6G0_9EURO|nr:hypothetical protein GJ744_003671 [Endocarpon pusillum]
MVRRQLSCRSHFSGSSTNSLRSDALAKIHSTARPTCSEKLLLKYHHDHSARAEEPLDYDDYGSSCSSLASVDTYASTLESEDVAHRPKLEAPVTRYAVYASDAIASTPADFAKSFTSNRSFHIQHDDATSDGNMNLRVDTEVVDSHGRLRKLILFHLRMHDLKDRRFSLRRYYRDSGRQICSSSRKFSPMPVRMPAKSHLQQSLGHPFQQHRPNHSGSVSHPNASSEQEPGQLSIASQYYTPSNAERCSPEMAASTTDTVHLEFANYAHINLNKQGLKRSKRYEYEFWGTKYRWRRQIYQHGRTQEVSYHLISDKTSKSIAHITPKSLTAREAQEEEDLGGWVPPCTMQITDRRIFQGLTDVADTIVATGLIALVDDCIERRWHSKRSFHLDLPFPESAGAMGPDALIDKIFNRNIVTTQNNY